MARSPFTLAAAVTAALPGAEVRGARPLSTGYDGRFDSAVATLADGRELVIRVADDDDAARELAAEALALRALTAGARAILPFRAPTYLGETRLDDSHALVTDLLPGFQVEAAVIPAGRGAAASIGEAIAAVHALPASVVRSAGLSARTAEESREEIRQLIDRASATGRVPARLTVRWREAADEDELWRFVETVVLGGVQATSFVLEDDATAGPGVVGIVHWHGLSIGDPAIDLAWLSSAPEASESVHAAYAKASDRSPDTALAVRARLLAELEFARWLLHGENLRKQDIIDDATQLLEALSEGLRNDDLTVIAAQDTDVDSALDALDRVPQNVTKQRVSNAPATSMETDAYNPEDLILGTETVEIQAGMATEDLREISVSGLLREESPAEQTATTEADLADEDEAQRAARAALQRWSRSDSE